MKRRLQGSIIKYKLIDTILSPVKRFKYKKPNFQINVYLTKVILCYILSARTNKYAQKIPSMHATCSRR